MATIEQKLASIATALTAKGIKFEITGEVTTMEVYNGYVIRGKYFEGQIGYRTERAGHSVWHWFKFYNDLDTLFCSHSYNQCTGNTRKCVSHRIAMRKRLEKLTGVEL